MIKHPKHIQEIIDRPDSTHEIELMIKQHEIDMIKLMHKQIEELRRMLGC